MYDLLFITPIKTVFDQQATSVIAPGADGYFQILTGHTPYMTSLIPGKCIVTATSGQKSIYAISGGVLEMLDGNCTLLADACENDAEIDVERALAAYDRAIHRLVNPEPGINLVRARQALLRADNRIQMVRNVKEGTFAL